MKKIALFFILLFIIFSTPTLANNKTSDINILYTIDNNYPNFTLLSINSILKNNKSKSSYTFYIIENNLSQKNKLKMQTFIEKRGQKVHFINIKQQDLSLFGLYNHPSVNYITSIALARIFAPNLLPQNINRILYLDADTLTISDLKEIYNIDLENNIAGLVLNDEQAIYPKSFHTFKNGYYNSGVILFDLEKCRKEKCTEKIVSYYLKNIDDFTASKEKEIGHYFYLIDQDLISLAWDGQIKSLNPKWNQQHYKIFNCGILHYTGNYKPWDFHFRNRASKIYVAYWKEIPELKFYKYLYALKSFYKKYQKSLKNKLNKQNLHLRKYILNTSSLQ